MDFGLIRGDLPQQRTGCTVVGVYKGRVLSRQAAELDRSSAQAISRLLSRGDLDGTLGTTLLLHDVPNVASERVLLVGLDAEAELNESRYRALLSSAVKALLATGAVEATMCLPDLRVNGRPLGWKIEQAILAVMEVSYRFDAMKSKPSGTVPVLNKVAFHVGVGEELAMAEAAIARAVAIAEGVVLAKDLGNLPGNVCTPSYLAERAQEMGDRHGFRVDSLGRKDLEALGMGGLLAVARGSCQPPRLVVMDYGGGDPETPPIVLIGKGITFDAGGISIKPAPEMDEMKFDMCGAASVLGALHATALLKLPLHVVGIIPAAENMPGGNATRPGDVVTTMSGQTVEILDTDSEGRLLLGDALTYAERFKPAAVIDIATLTGEIVRALGDVASGLFTRSDALAQEVLVAGEEAWDRAWRMPLWDDYQDALRSNFADIPNIGSQADCAVTAACFLSRFAGGFAWAHLDIAGTASRSGPEKGATGRPVALLTHFLVARAARTRPRRT